MSSCVTDLVALLERLLQQPPADRALQHLDAVPLDALLAQLAHRDLAIVDRGGDAGHLPAKLRIVVDVDDLTFGTILKLLENVGRRRAELFLHDHLGQPPLGLLAIDFHLGHAPLALDDHVLQKLLVARAKRQRNDRRNLAFAELERGFFNLRRPTNRRIGWIMPFMLALGSLLCCLASARSRRDYPPPVRERCARRWRRRAR